MHIPCLAGRADHVAWLSPLQDETITSLVPHIPLSHCLANVGLPFSPDQTPPPLTPPLQNLLDTLVKTRDTHGVHFSGHLELIRMRIGEIVPWKLCKCLPELRTKVCVEGKGQVRQGVDKSPGYVCRTEGHWKWSADADWFGRAPQPPASGSAGPMAALGPGPLQLCLCQPDQTSRRELELDCSSSLLNYLLFPRLQGDRAEGREFRGKLMAADSLLKEKSNVLWMLCRA